MDKVLVTGGAGFIGSNLVHRLVNKGYNVRILDNGFRGNFDRLQEHLNDIEIIQGDVRDPDDMNRACKGIQTIFHLAAINGTRYFYETPGTVLEVATKGIVHGIDAAIRNDISKFILASSSEVYGEPANIPTPESHPAVISDVNNPRFSYAGGKIISELWVLHYGKLGYFQPMVFRPFNVYGPNMGAEHVIPEFVQRIRSLSHESMDTRIKMPIQGSGKETRTFCYIQDFIDGIMLMWNHGKPGEVYNIGNDLEETEISDLAKAIASLLSVEITLAPTPLRVGSSVRRCPDISKLRALGFCPKISLREGLKPTVDWYLQNN